MRKTEQLLPLLLMFTLYTIILLQDLSLQVQYLEIILNIILVYANLLKKLVNYTFERLTSIEDTYIKRESAILPVLCVLASF